MRRDLERQLRGEVATLTHERDHARRELDRVTAQRDELRRVIGDVRSYARQEAERAVADNLQRRGSQLKLRDDLPDYLWPSPDGIGWVDAWNGWYADLPTALADSAGGGDRPWVLGRGEAIVTYEEQERRMKRANHMRPTVALAAHLSDPEPVCTCLQDEHSTWATCPLHSEGWKQR